MGRARKERAYSEMTGKLHIQCPHRKLTGVCTHVVIMGRYCYRSDNCMVLKCKYNKTRDNIENVLSMTW